MKKYFTLLIFFIFFNSCGYTSLYKNKELKNFKINFDIVNTNVGNDINLYLINNLNRYLDFKITEKYEIEINSAYSKSSISKNKKGETTVYLLSLETEFKIIDDNDNMNEFVFNEKIKINKLNDNFEQENYEINIKKEMAKLVINRLINKLIEF